MLLIFSFRKNMLKTCAMIFGKTCAKEITWLLLDLHVFLKNMLIFLHNTWSCSYFIFRTTIRCWKNNPKERNVDEGNIFVIKTNPRMFAFFWFQSTFLVDFSCFKVKGFSFWPKWSFWKDFLCVLEKMSDASDWLHMYMLSNWKVFTIKQNLSTGQAENMLNVFEPNSILLRIWPRTFCVRSIFLSLL